MRVAEAFANGFVLENEPILRGFGGGLGQNSRHGPPGGWALTYGAKWTVRSARAAVFDNQNTGRDACATNILTGAGRAVMREVRFLEGNSLYD
jgi:hypothetical protein